jgi:DNA polymerase (family 10)
MDDVDYKPFAYQRAASSIINLETDLRDIYEKKGREGIEEVSGVGEAIADKIEEYLLTGEMEHLKKLKKKFPVEMENLLRVEGLGPKSVKKLYDNLKITNLKELKKAAEDGKISKLDGFGKKTEKNIKEAINFLEKDEGKWALGEVLPRAKEIFNALNSLKEVEKINFAGSLRRMKEVVGDVDILVSAKKTKRIMKAFTSFKGIDKVLSVGETKASIKLREGFDVDLRIVDKNSFGAALQYFTGSKNHNIRVRKLAVKKGYKLNEYGLFKNGKRVAGKTEKEIYNKLGLNFIPPEVREDKGEVKEAFSNEFSNLCKVEDIKGDLHTHTNWTGGANTIEKMAKEAIKFGYNYIGIADHTKFLKIENGLNEEELLKQREEIKRVNEKLKDKNFTILQGCEANILKDGSLDIDDKSLEQLDYVVAGIHSNFNLEREEMTERLIKAIDNPLVD